MRARLRIGAAMALLTAGCATPGPPVVTPEVRLERVEVDEVGLYGQTFLLGFAVSNPNPFPLPVKSVRYEVRLDDRRFVGGTTRGGFVVPAGDSGTFAISVETDLLHAPSGFEMLLDSGADRQMRYELDGLLRVDIPGAAPVRFTKSGSVRFRAD